MKAKLLALSLAIFLIQSCVYDELAEPAPPGPCAEPVSYADQVRPIVNTNCAITGCHNGDMGPSLNWTVFDTFQQNSADVKDRINRPPGTPGHMPAQGSITAEQIQTITCWVDQGALNN